MKILSLKDKGSGKYNTAIPSDQLTSSQVTGRLMPAKVDGVHLKIGASNSVHEVVWEGTNCTTIDVQDSVINLLAAKELLNQLPIASSKTVISSLLPYDKSLVDATDVVVGIEKVPCKLCNKEVDMKQMRLHVGKHILENNLSNVCGFCGTQGYSIGFKKSSGRVVTATLSAQANCTYISKFSLKAAEKTTKSSPCTNRPVSCPVCNTVVWSYMMGPHYSHVHPEKTLCTSVTSEERDMVLKKK